MDCVRFSAKSSQTWVVSLSCLPERFVDVVNRANQKDVKIGKAWNSNSTTFIVCWPTDEQKSNVQRRLDVILNGDQRCDDVVYRILIDAVTPLDMFHAEEWGLVPCFDDPHKRRFKELSQRAKSKMEAAKASKDHEVPSESKTEELATESKGNELVAAENAALAEFATLGSSWFAYLDCPTDDLSLIHI